MGRQEEEALRQAEEEERRRLEETEQRKAERKERRAEMKRQGLILTGKAKKEAERLAAFREQLMAQSCLPPGPGAAVCWHALLLMVPGMRGVRMQPDQAQSMSQ